MQNIIKLKQHFKNIIDTFNNSNSNKIFKYLQEIPLKCSLNYRSKEYRKLRELDENKLHPKGVSRGEVYNLKITEGIGSELSDNHLVIIIQNKKGNIYGEKVNVIPIEGDGNKIKPAYHIQLFNTHLIEGKLDKNPSRIVISDIMTYDKARLGSYIGRVKPEIIKEVNLKLKRQLEL